MAKADLTAERLRELLHYDPETGIFTWLNSSSGRGRVIKAGAIAGVGRGHRYIRIGFFGYRNYAHRLAWLYVYGKFPVNHIDHINGNGHDNRIKNLREATHAENHQNTKIRVDNSIGFTGVYFHKTTGKWRAAITANKKTHSLGLFRTPELAYEAYLEAKSKLHAFNPKPRRQGLAAPTI